MRLNLLLTEIISVWSQISCACRWLGVSIWLLSPQDYTTTLARGKLIYSWSNSGQHFCLYMQRFSLCKYCRLKKCMSADALCFGRGLLVIWETCQRSVTQTLREKKKTAFLRCLAKKKTHTHSIKQTCLNHCQSFQRDLHLARHLQSSNKVDHRIQKTASLRCDCQQVVRFP